LPALENTQVMGKLFKWVLAHLNPRQRMVLPAFIYQEASQHTAQATLAFLGIHNKVAFGRWNL
jgi:hypothetical protein